MGIARALLHGCIGRRASVTRAAHGDAGVLLTDRRGRCDSRAGQGQYGSPNTRGVGTDSRTRTPIWTPGWPAFQVAPNGGLPRADWPPGRRLPHCSSAVTVNASPAARCSIGCCVPLRRAGLNSQRAPGVLVHGFRHTFATELANENVSVYALMKLLGHESMVTSQRYVDGAGTENRAAAAQNPPVRPYRSVAGTVVCTVSLTRPGSPAMRVDGAPERKVDSVTDPASRES